MKSTQPSQPSSAMRVSALWVYPLKSARGIPVQQAKVTPLGLAGDRRWMVVDEDGGFITARTHPQLLQLQAVSTPEGLWLQASGGERQWVDSPAVGATTMDVVVWDDRVRGHLACAAAHRWLSSVLGVRCKLVYMADDTRRPVDRRHASEDDHVSFADGFPLLLTTDGSLSDLNARLNIPVTMAHFRPNLVVSGVSPFAEDRWLSIRIGAVIFGVVKPCARCVMTTCDPHTGERHPRGEPLKTLATYRKDDRGILFGQNLTVRHGGSIAVGDPVEVLTAR